MGEEDKLGRGRLRYRKIIRRISDFKDSVIDLKKNVIEL